MNSRELGDKVRKKGSRERGREIKKEKGAAPGGGASRERSN